MRNIIPGLVWIGNARDARDAEKIMMNGIETVIQLAIEEPTVQLPRELVYCRFPLLDGEGNSPIVLGMAIDTVSRFILSKSPMLVTCSAGMSRSPTIVSFALAVANRSATDEWIKRISAQGPLDVAPALWNDANKWFSKL